MRQKTTFYMNWKDYIFRQSLRYSLRLGQYRLPTHRRGAHRMFLVMPSYFKIEVLVMP